LFRILDQKLLDVKRLEAVLSLSTSRYFSPRRGGDVYDTHIRTQLAKERAEDLKRYWPIDEREHRVRRALAAGLIRAGKKLAPESTPRPELSPRA
jgi:hypothetical protein